MARLSSARMAALLPSPYRHALLHAECHAQRTRIAHVTKRIRAMARRGTEGGRSFFAFCPGPLHLEDQALVGGDDVTEDGARAALLLADGRVGLHGVVMEEHQA